MKRLTPARCGWGVAIHEGVLYLGRAAPGLPDEAALPWAAVLSAAMWRRSARRCAAGAGSTARDRSAECGGG